jgi:hypothetical protein
MLRRALARCAVFFLLASLTVVPTALAALPNQPVQIVPAAPCPSDDVRLVFTICTCNEHFIAAHRIDETHAQLDVAVNPTVVCVQCAPDTLGISLGRFPAGSHHLDVDIVGHVIAGPDSGTTHVEHYQLDFEVSASCPPPPNAIPYLNSVGIGQPGPCEVCPPRVCAGDSIPVFFRGTFTSPCLSLTEIRLVPRTVVPVLGAPPIVQLLDRDLSAPGAAILVPWHGEVRLPPLRLGSYSLPVEAYLDDGCIAGDSLQFLAAAQYAFTVSGSCADSLPHVDRVTIGTGSPCDGCIQVACSGDSIPIALAGHFDDDCIAIDTVLIAPNPSAGPSPQPDIVKIVYRINSCIERPCQTGEFLWGRSVRIGGLPPNRYGLPVEVYLRDACTTALPALIGRAVIPFNVQDTCGVPRACYLASFAHPNATGCDAIVGPDQPGEATFQVLTAAPIGGIQGRLQFEQPGLRVTHIEAVAPGALLSWVPKPDGATFVFVTGPVAIPLNGSSLTPIFRVRVEQIPGVPLEGLVRLHAVELLVSDAHGIAVPECAERSDVRLAVDPAARFCPEQGCDFNADLHADVRDLVLMVGCILHPDGCPPGASDHLDCDGDGDKDIDDVLCCARVILGGGRPDSVGAQPAPGVSVQLGAPVAVSGGLDVPITLMNSDAVGAARLAFTYPDQVFEAASIELAAPSTSWLALDQTGGGHATVGVIRIAPNITTGASTASIEPLRMTLHLQTRAGQGAAGAVAFVAGDVASASGVTLETLAIPVSMPLAAGLRLAVTPARPNPFTSETRFSVMLTQDADLDLSVYDLLGRRVATLFKGRASAGTREYTWRRTRDDGAAVPSGVYFYRAVTGRETASQKVLVLSRQ